MVYFQSKLISETLYIIYEMINDLKVSVILWIVLILDPKSAYEMVLYKEIGVCTNGYYAGADGIKDLESCFDQCLGELECLYVSFVAETSCSRFKSHNCGISLSHTKSAKRSVTYRKIKKGTCMSLFTIYVRDDI